VLGGAAWLGLVLCLIGLQAAKAIAVYGIAIFVSGQIILSDFGMTL
jgi:hypothetical protein